MILNTKDIYKDLSSISKKIVLIKLQKDTKLKDIIELKKQYKKKLMSLYEK